MEDPDADGVATTASLRFPGQYHDGESGLFYNGARYYDPKTGRDITADPVSIGEHVRAMIDRLHTAALPGRRLSSANDALIEAGFGFGAPAQVNQPVPPELNPYAYTANNPLRWTDPSGEAVAAIEACLANPGACVGAGISAGAAAIGAGIAAMLYSPALCENEDADRCKEVKRQCIEGCSTFVLEKPRRRRGDLGGIDFHECVRQCMDRNGC